MTEKVTDNDQESTTPPNSPQKFSLIDRYLDYSRQEQTTGSSLEAANIRITQLREELERFCSDKDALRQFWEEITPEPLEEKGE